jgi:hypothetical protein
LITVLLFYQLPIEIKHPGFDEGILMYVILISSLIMTGSLIYESNKSVAAEAGENNTKSENHEDHSDPH